MAEIEAERIALKRAHTQPRVSVEFLRPNPRSPRRNYPESDLDELAASIRERGIIQPIVVRALHGAKDAYEIIAGERRWRAAQRAGLHDVPIVLIEVGDAETLELAIIENVQRAHLDPLEEAAGYQMLAGEYGHSQDDIAKIVGKSRSYVANTLRLLKLCDRVKDYIHSGNLTAGHARLLVSQPNAQELAEEIVQRGLSVRQVEELARERVRDAKKANTRARVKNHSESLALEKRLSDVLGLRVSIGGGERGVLFVRYTNFEQLYEVLRRLENRH
jgi:ParB family chromosome partitioning protein